VISIPNSIVLNCLSKYEEKELMFIERDENQTITYHLPRFDLRFELRDNSLISKNYTGCILSKSQSIENFLPEFNNYLVLETLESDPGFPFYVLVLLMLLNLFFICQKIATHQYQVM
jgi:hypothetical protein